jgi:hypothetical protein
VKYKAFKYLFSLGLTIALLIVGLYHLAVAWVSFEVQIPLIDYYHQEGKKRAYFVMMLGSILAIVCYMMGWKLALIIWCISVIGTGMFLFSF